MITEVLLLVFLAALVIYYWQNSSDQKLPPGPFCLPIIGSIKQVMVADDARELHRKFGDVFRIKMASITITFICNFKLAKEAFLKTECSDRPHYKSFHYLSDGREAGVIFSNGQRWQNVRRFLLRNLRDLGMGKSYLDSAIQEEAVMLVNDFKKYDGKETPIPQSVNIAALNVIWQLVAGCRYDLNDEEIHTFIKLIKSLQEDTTAFMLPECFPILNYLPGFLTRKLLRTDLIEEIKRKAFQLTGKTIESHKAKLDPNNPRDLIDEYLLEMSKKSDIAAFFSEEDLTRNIFDLFSAGFDTSSSMLRWICLYMAAYPEVQQRVQREIDNAVPRDKLPSHNEKSQLQYLEAVIHEVLRISSLIPFSVGHYVTKDIEIGGYLLPKGTTFLGCSVICHEDPNYWQDPKQFNPDRFLDNDGKFVSQKEGFFPFGIGRRQCLGEALARMEMFIFSAALLQNFTFSPLPNKQIDLQPDSIPFIQFAKDQDIVIAIRK
ncbi:cytochrome P450 2L1 isoform X1 [Procambarus clarkii]|uniref:cytochrome P450 2L1 isoform X1 n=1 Tax=Procambarus clarkii TaxID=6728 RepID=UPI001E678C24|nr:cytochrome P450 2L1-like isoform X2 [Procambarus clarkii]